MKPIQESIIREAAQRLLQAAPGGRVILFGSHARGDEHKDSDLDFLVILPKVESRRDQMTRLRDVLRPFGIPADVLVTSREVFDEWCTTPNNVYFEAAQEGRIFDEVETAGARAHAQGRRR